MMKKNRIRHRILVFVTCVVIGFICAVLQGQNSLPPSDANANARILVQEQMDLAEKAPDRDTRLVHLRKALTIRPDNPDNLAIEFRIAVELSQRYGPKYPDQTPRRDEALVIYERLLKKYNHMDYYSPEPVDRSYAPQLMVPAAAVHLACLYRGLHDDSAKARDCLIFAMDCLKQTHEKRIEDWSNAPAPPKPDPNSRYGGLSSPMEKWEARLAYWKKRRQDAVEGNVLGSLEMSLIRAEVRQFGYTFGPQKPYEVPVIMGQIIKMFPDTPMARVAQEHISRANAMAEKELSKELQQRLENLPSLDSPELDAEADSPVDTSVGSDVSVRQLRENRSEVPVTTTSQR
ncbi:MAG: hypothetical protein HQ559_05880 [Lentisphaerae bacterium]|nr:hypothetical protein [Lentisphaerota bacterium]